jgi:hypothetical protein
MRRNSLHMVVPGARYWLVRRFAISNRSVHAEATRQLARAHASMGSQARLPPEPAAQATVPTESFILTVELRLRSAISTPAARRPGCRVGGMSEEQGFKERVTRQGEEAIGKLAQELLENPVVSGALSAAFETRERAMRAQEVAMGALNLPSASDLERLTRRVRSVSQRLEGIEDGLDRLDDRLERSPNTPTLDDRLTRIEAALERLEATKPAARKPAAAKPRRAKPPADRS